MFLRALFGETIPERELQADKRSCRKIGPAGIGEKALFLGGFFLDRTKYIPVSEVKRVYKRIAMSKGGYTGRGLFASLSYLVVEYGNGETYACRFKYEPQLDLFLDEIGTRFPNIPLHSEKAEQRLRESEEAEQRRYQTKLSEKALSLLDDLCDAEAFLEQKPERYRMLTKTAKTKRMAGYTNPFYKHLQYLILSGAILLFLTGGYALYRAQGFTIYVVLFGFSLILLFVSIRVKPTGVKNRADADREWEEAVRSMAAYLKERQSFPLPPQYAHPSALKRMRRIVREGRAESEAEALTLLKKELKALNSSVEVSQRDYDEVVAIKPMFLCMDYR